MKALIGLIAIFSVSAFASTVECDISARQKNGNYASVDSITLGQLGYTFSSEVGRAIKGQQDLYINIRLGSDDSLEIDLLSGNATRFTGKLLAEAAGNASGLRLTSVRNGISVLCMKK